MPTVASAATGRGTFVVIDGGIPRGHEPEEAFPVGTVLRLDPGGDGPAEIARALAGCPGPADLHLITPGAPGMIRLGEVVLSVETLQADARLRSILATIGGRLAPGAGIMLCGSDVGHGNRGLAFIQALAEAIGADVCALVHGRPRRRSH